MYNVTTNRLVEVFNKTVCNLLKKMVPKMKRAWQEKFSEVLWTYRTTHRTPIEVMSYSLVYGAEVVLPLVREIHC